MPLTASAMAANQVTTDTEANVTEWAKKSACWTRVKAVHVEWDDNWIQELIDRDQYQHAQRAARKDQKVLNGDQAQTAVFNAGPDLWRGLKE
jgi:hypothetical protein